MNITLQLGKGIVRSVNTADFGFTNLTGPMAAVMQHIVHKGLENVVKDTHAGLTKEKVPNEAERIKLSAEACDEKIADLKKGLVTSRSRSVDAKTLVTGLGANIAEFMTDEQLAAVMAAIEARGKKNGQSAKK